MGLQRISPKRLFTKNMGFTSQDDMVCRELTLLPSAGRLEDLLEEHRQNQMKSDLNCNGRHVTVCSVPSVL